MVVDQRFGRLPFGALDQAHFGQAWRHARRVARTGRTGRIDHVETTAAAVVDSLQHAVGAVVQRVPVAVAVFQAAQLEGGAGGTESVLGHAEVAVHAVVAFHQKLAQFGTDQVIAFGRAVMTSAGRDRREADAASLFVAIVQCRQLAERVALERQGDFVRNAPAGT